MLFEDESMIRDYQAIQKTWFLLAGSNASFQPRASIVGSNCWPRLTMKRDTSFGKKMNSTPLKRFFPFFKGHGDLSNRETGSGFGQCPDSSCKAASAVSGSAKIGLSQYFALTQPLS
ncbi:hypothetical protein P7H20_22060 [Paenibacillus larvae]|nr:hypothetical protein [Paenibacillus larvae]MDT2276993.1 hypothetical protein [Paenibacillus larvae]